MDGVVTENNMADTNASMLGTLSPEDYAQQQQITRQQRFADMLMAQNQQPQGQMVSGRYVAPSFFQMLNPVANMLAGAYVGKESDTKAAQLAQKLRNQEMSDLEKYQAMYSGTPAQAGGIAGPSGITKETTADMYGPNMELNAPYKKVEPVAAQQANPQAANLFAASSYSPALRAMGMKKITEGPKWEKVEKLDAHGNTVTGFIDVNSSSPESTFRPLGVSKPAVSEAEAARLRDEGIPYGGGNYNTSAVVSSNVPASNNGVVTTSSNMPTSNAAVASSNVPNGSTGNIPMTPIVNMNGVSPKEQRAIKTKQLEDTQANVKNAYEVFSVVKQIEDTLPKAHGSGIGNIVGGAYNFVGADNPKNEADAQLKILGSKLLMQVPRFQGPQSDKDVATYKEAAGQIGDPTIPANVRMAALKTIKELNARYAPNLDWGLVKPTPLPNAPKTQASPAPAGVPADVWAVMTPQEKALWK